MVAEYIPLYFEGSWSILSSIGLVNTLLGLLVIGITGFSPIALVPITCSIAGAIGNGLCYFVLYEEHGPYVTMIGGIFADLFWLIEEAGFSFYSYLILRRILRARARITFITLFWIILALIIAIRLAILVCRANTALHAQKDLQVLISHLHIGYFILIAVIEILSSYFLIRIFHQAKKSSAEIASRGGLFRYLTQSTELRLATLTLIGITRAITYSFQRSALPSDITGQLDRFVTTLECCFPMVMYIDILASRIATTNYTHAALSNSPLGPLRSNTHHNHPYPPRSHAEMVADMKLFSTATHTRSHIGTLPDPSPSCSQERMIIMSDVEKSGSGGVVCMDSSMGARGGGYFASNNNNTTTTTTATDARSQRPCDTVDGAISKTVEFEFRVNAV